LRARDYLPVFFATPFAGFTSMRAEIRRPVARTAALLTAATGCVGTQAADRRLRRREPKLRNGLFVHPF